VLACDVRFASREKAVFGQPEVGPFRVLYEVEGDLITIARIDRV
jgi:enoyl-CoA hydratase/carnithine racemase